MWETIVELVVIPGDVAIRLFVSMALAFIMGLGIALLYRLTHRGLNYEPSFLATLVLLGPIVALVMMFIRGDLVLSLGLVGSLSIIRFRTPIKDTRDMVYLFWVIAAGLGCGTENWALVLISTVFLAICISILYLVEYGRPRHADFVMVVSGAFPYRGKGLEEIIRHHTVSARVRSHESRDDFWETVFELRLSRAQERSTEKLIQEMRQAEGIERVSLLAPQLALPL